MDSSYQFKVVSSVEQAKSLFEKVKPTQPFLQFEFWQALEQQAVIGERTGWIISHILIEQASQPAAWMPLFIKSHHRGEYVFDHSWADAYARHGLDYYPRLVSSVPFTPVTGERILLAPTHAMVQVWPIIFNAVQQVAEQHHASVLHALFIDQPLLEFFQRQNYHQSATQLISESPPLAIRQHCQFLWTNQNYAEFEDFLAVLTAKNAKVLKLNGKN